MSSQAAPNTSSSNVAALKLVAVPPRGVYLARNACYNCNHNKDLVVFPTLIETEGQLALCSRCIKRAAKLIGLTDPVQLKLEHIEVLAKLKKAESTIEQQGTVIASYEAIHKAKERITALDEDQPIPGLSSEEVPA